MERGQGAHFHIVAFPFPAQGHINPMLQFSKILASKGLKITLLTLIDEKLFTKAIKGSSVLTVESMYKDGEDQNMDISSLEDYMQKLRSKLERKLTEIVANQVQISCLFYDSVMPWALDVAKQFGLIRACFFTQSCSVSAIFCQVRQGKFDIPDKHQLGCESLDGLPPLESHDLPSSDGIVAHVDFMSAMTAQFSNLEEADWIFFNSFDSLEEEVMKWMASQLSVKLIGPTILFNYLDKRVDENNDYGLSLFTRNINCMEWLDSKETCSVVYVSFGSMASLNEKQMEELASGLRLSNYHFLWVVRDSEENKLPKSFLEETSETGMVVNWCPQVQVLAHKSVGCFMTHCGWNSTTEALSLGVPMVAMPNSWDQNTNAKFVADVWKVGVRVKVDEDGIVRKEEIQQCISEVMDGKNRNEIRKNSEKWKKLANEAVDEGGSSRNNIEEIVAKFQFASK